MQTIKVIDLSDSAKFEKEVNDWLAKGYIISSTSCGFVQSEKYEFCTSYQAVLVCNAKE
jgi:hypothetical protein